MQSQDKPAAIWNQNAVLADADMLIEEQIIAENGEQTNARDLRLRHEINLMREDSDARRTD